MILWVELFVKGICQESKELWLKALWAKTMNEELMIAYDLKHQIECLPQEYKSSSVIDNVTTEHTMLERIAMIIHVLESYGKDVS